VVGKEEGQVLSKVERIYGRVQYLERGENLGNTKEVIKEFEEEYQ